MDIPLFVGFDPIEAAAYHVFCQSVIERASLPVSFRPLHKGMLAGFDGKRDGTNAFIFSRYLVPHLMAYQGWAIFADGDMVVQDDIVQLWNERDPSYAVIVVKHDYTTKHPRKYIGSTLENDNKDYPRKNWSSVILWNCAHPANRILTPEFISAQSGSYLHRFSWLEDALIGRIIGWNHLVGEYSPAKANLYHYTLGVPGIRYYADDYASWHWHAALLRALQCAGEDPVAMVKRSQERIGAVQ